MHRRLVISFATMLGASALLVAPGASAAPAVVTAEQAFLEPDDVVPISIAAHQDDYWEQYLADQGYASAICTKDDRPGDSPYVVPNLRLLAVVLANDGLDWGTANEVYLRPPAGSLIEHEGLLHVFVCQPEQGGPLPTTSPPVVETDRVDDTGGTNAALVLAAGATTAGAAALFLSRHRQGRTSPRRLGLAPPVPHGDDVGVEIQAGPHRRLRRFRNTSRDGHPRDRPPTDATGGCESRAAPGSEPVLVMPA